MQPYLRFRLYRENLSRVEASRRVNFSECLYKNWKVDPFYLSQQLSCMPWLSCLERADRWPGKEGDPTTIEWSSKAGHCSNRANFSFLLLSAHQVAQGSSGRQVTFGSIQGQVFSISTGPIKGNQSLKAFSKTLCEKVQSILLVTFVPRLSKSNKAFPTLTMSV